MRISITLGSKFTRGRKECEVCTLLGVSLPTSKTPFYAKRKEKYFMQNRKKDKYKSEWSIFSGQNP